MTPEEDAAKDTDTSVDYFGKALLKAGYQYYGSEPLYSGMIVIGIINTSKDFPYVL